MVLFSYLFCCLRLPAGFPALNGPQQSFALPQAQQSEYRRRNADITLSGGRFILPARSVTLLAGK